MKAELFAVTACALLLCCQGQVSRQPAQQTAAQQNPAAARKQTISVAEVLGLRSAYGDLLGKPKEVAVERFGEPSTEDRPGAWTWEASPKTNDRMVTIEFGDRAPHTAFEVKVYASDQEQLDPVEILKRAPQFNFTTGTYRDSVTSYLVAETKDGRNDLEFNVGDNDVRFSAALFNSTGVESASIQTSKLPRSR